MTLVVGVRCKDGAVIGADSITTYASADGRRTVEQEVDSKISIVDNNMIFASSGAVGLSQEVLEHVRGYWRKGKNKRYMSMRKGLADSISRPIKAHMERAIGAAPLLGDSIIGRAIVSSVIALPCENQQTLFKFDELANAEEYTPELPFVSIGSGQSLADPFLAFVKRVVWNNRQPDTVRHGIVGLL